MRDLADGRNAEALQLARKLASLLLAAALSLAVTPALASCGEPAPTATPANPAESPATGTGAQAWGTAAFDYGDIPRYAGSPSVTVNGNVPFFSDADFDRGDATDLSELDSLGRAGAAFAIIGPGTLAEGARGTLKTLPSGFSLSKYDWIPGKYLYNRCHLLAYKLTGIGDDARDLVTGTRYLNIDGMQPYERAVQAYVEQTGNRVLYRATPVFEGDELVARGILLEAASYEDRGATLLECAWCYNVQPGVDIDYATGENRSDGTMSAEAAGAAEYKYLVNKSSKVFHPPDCPTGSTTKESNRIYSDDSRDDLIEMGYAPCGNCRP